MKKILFFLLFALFLIPGYAFSGEVASRGVAVREVEADRVSLRVMAQADAEGQAEAVRNAGEIVKIIEKEMEKFPPDRVTVETSSLRVIPVYHYGEKGRVFSHYSAMASWKVTGGALSEILQMANTLSGREYGERAFVGIDGLQWTLSPGLERETREELIAEAVRYAKADGESALQAIGLQLKKILKIEIDGASLETVRAALPETAGVALRKVSGAPASEPPMVEELKRGIIPCRMEVVLVAGF